MNKPNTIETSFSALGEKVHAEATRRGVAPFVRYADKAFAAACGIDSLIGLLRRDQMDREDCDDAPVLSAYDIDVLLGLVQFAAFALHEDVGGLRDWAEKHFVRGGDQ